jgi:hypothetical protein
MQGLAPLDDWVIFSAYLRHTDPLTCTEQIPWKATQVLGARLDAEQIPLHPLCVGRGCRTVQSLNE